MKREKEKGRGGPTKNDEIFKETKKQTKKRSRGGSQQTEINSPSVRPPACSAAQPLTLSADKY